MWYGNAKAQWIARAGVHKLTKDERTIVRWQYVWMSARELAQDANYDLPRPKSSN